MFYQFFLKEFDHLHSVAVQPPIKQQKPIKMSLKNSFLNYFDKFCELFYKIVLKNLLGNVPALLVLILILVILTVYENVYYTDLFEISGKLDNLVTFFLSLFVRITFLVSFIEMILKRQDHLSYLEKLPEIDEIFLKEFGMVTKKRRDVQLNFMISVVFWLLCSTVIQIYEAYDSEFNQSNAAIILIFWIPIMVNSLRCFQLISTVSVIENRFTILNECLCTLSLKEEPEISTVIPMSVDRFYINFRKIVVLKDLYDRIWKLSNLTNSYHDRTILLNVTNSFLWITAMLYYIYTDIIAIESAISFISE